MPHTLTSASRRQFLKAGTLATVGGTLLSTLSPSAIHAAGGDTLRIGIVGCGGRGTGAAAQALRADKNVKLELSVGLKSSQRRRMPPRAATSSPCRGR